MPASPPAPVAVDTTSLGERSLTHGGNPAAAAASRATGSYALLLGVLGLMWGSSYLWIKIGVETLPPLSLVFFRTLVGVAILGGVVAVTRTRLPRDARTIAALAVMGALDIALPFWLIGWAEQRIDSGLAGMLQSTAPFFTLVLSAWAVHDERITPGRIAGIAIGFAGILVLSVPELSNLQSATAAETLAGEAMVIASSILYGAGNAFARRALRGTPPIVLATGQVGWAMVMVGVAALVVDGGLTVPAAPGAVASVLWLGIVGTAVAYLIFFRLLTGWGPTRASLVAYLLPVVAVVLGVVVLGEHIDAWFAAGSVLIVGGVWVVNRRG